MYWYSKILFFNGIVSPTLDDNDVIDPLINLRFFAATAAAATAAADKLLSDVTEINDKFLRYYVSQYYTTAIIIIITTYCCWCWCCCDSW